jgi:hypothetical protein
MKYVKVNSTNFFDDLNYKTIANRLQRISESSPRKWGAMDVAQMLHHLNSAIGSD